jgi:hypothetical protein
MRQATVGMRRRAPSERGEAPARLAGALLISSLPRPTACGAPYEALMAPAIPLGAW